MNIDHRNKSIPDSGAGSIRPEYAKPNEIARLMGLSRGTVITLVKAGKLDGCFLRVSGKKCRAIVISIASARAFLAREIINQGANAKSKRRNTLESLISPANEVFGAVTLGGSLNKSIFIGDESIAPPPDGPLVP